MQDASELTMKYFKYLDLNFQPASNKLREYLIKENKIDDIKSSWRYLDTDNILKEIPELTEIFLPFNIDIATVGIFVSYMKEGSIHIDNVNFPCRINFPVLNCEDTVTNFFKTTTPPIVRKQVNGLLFHQYNSESCELADQMYLTQATVMRVQEPHQVVMNHDRYPRVSCTISFHQDISYLLDT